MNKRIEPLIPVFNREQGLISYIRMLKNPNASLKDRTKWEKLLPLTEEEKNKFILEARATYNLSLLHKI